MSHEDLYYYTNIQSPKYLLECLESFINQTCPPFEIIVGDDSSNQESEKMVASLD